MSKLTLKLKSDPEGYNDLRETVMDDQLSSGIIDESQRDKLSLIDPEIALDWLDYNAQIHQVLSQLLEDGLLSDEDVQTVGDKMRSSFMGIEALEEEIQASTTAELQHPYLHKPKEILEILLGYQNKADRDKVSSDLIEELLK